MKFSRKWSLTCHIILHTGKLPHTCAYCDTKFRTASYMNQHILAKHTSTNEPNHVYECSYCPLKSKDKGYMEIVHRRVHTGEKPFKCPVCDLRFRRMFALKHHSKIAHGFSKQDMMDAGMYSQLTVLKKSNIM